MMRIIGWLRDFYGSFCAVVRLMLRWFLRRLPTSLANIDFFVLQGIVIRKAADEIVIENPGDIRFVYRKKGKAEKG